MGPVYREARRWPGSEWIKNHPRVLASAYEFTRKAVDRVYPTLQRLNPTLAERLFILGEQVAKGYLFNCFMCGQCILHSTGMTCPMNCPKKLRNGPCGGVRPGGFCEVIPQMRCVWTQAWERSRMVPQYAHEMLLIQPPVDHRLQGTSAWANMVTGADQVRPEAWQELTDARAVTATES
ncbi:MAG: methylenetetrahydrofolate reductase C-terminal domain-containing protein [Anaerolineae bacterium]|jgi:hypothetical protein